MLIPLPISRLTTVAELTVVGGFDSANFHAFAEVTGGYASADLSPALNRTIVRGYMPSSRTTNGEATVGKIQ
jgi:hypothetical protein